MKGNCSLRKCTSPRTDFLSAVRPYSIPNLSPQDANASTHPIWFHKSLYFISPFLDSHRVIEHSPFRPMSPDADLPFRPPPIDSSLEDFPVRFPLMDRRTLFGPSGTVRSVIAAPTPLLVAVSAELVFHPFRTSSLPPVNYV